MSLSLRARVVGLALGLSSIACGASREAAGPAHEPPSANAATPEAPAPAPSIEPPSEPPPPPGPPPIRPSPELVIADTRTSPPATACRALAHIGDSTSTGMASEKYIADPDARIDARYRAVGVAELELELFGGRSLIEHRAVNENGLMVATRLREAGFRGCWVIGLGTNDAANVAKDPTVSRTQRIERMMEIIGDEPALWIDATTREDRAGYWARDNMAAWNADLRETLARYPMARIYAWSAEMRDDWYVRDGIHYTSAGYRERAERVARALAIAFPGEAPDPASPAPAR